MFLFTLINTSFVYDKKKKKYYSFISITKKIYIRFAEGLQECWDAN